MRFEVIDRYKITRELGKGAMGEVYLAYDPDLDREIAIKTILYDPGTPEADLKEAKIRFLREARVAAKLSHPHIVIIYDVGEFDGVPFIAMEFVRGETLDQYIKPTSLLPLHRVVEIIAQVADALDYAHRHDLVHRDIKPSNVMISQTGTVKVMDFGLAKKPTANLTQAGTLLGTPSYMAPEQIKGEALDGRADLFSLGVVLYQMLTGEKPFKGETITAIMYKILNEDPPAPTILNSKLPPQFDAIIRKVLAKNPDERFQSGRELKLALEDYLNFTARMSRIRLPSAKHAEGEATAALTIEHLPQHAPAPAAAPARKKPASSSGPFLRKAAAWAVTLLVLAGVAAAAYSPVKEWVREKSMDSDFPIPGFVISWANNGRNPRLETVTVTLLADPGTNFYVNGEALSKPSLEVPADGREVFDIVARKDCYETVHRLTPQDIRSSKVQIALAEGQVEVAVDSEPRGARVFHGPKDGELVEAPGVTPLTFKAGACRAHNIRLRLDGYKEGGDFVSFGDLGRRYDFNFKLEPLPSAVAVTFPKGRYPYEVFDGKKKIADGGKSAQIYPGDHQLFLVNKKLLLNQLFELTVKENQPMTAKPVLPETGTLTVWCPTNAKVFVNDEELGDVPINEYSIAAGKGYRLRAVVSGMSQGVTASFDVKAGKNTRILLKEQGPEVVNE